MGIFIMRKGKMEKPNFEAIAERVAFFALKWVPSNQGGFTLKATTEKDGLNRESAISMSTLYGETGFRARSELSVELSLNCGLPTVVEIEDFASQILARAAAIAQQCIETRSYAPALKHEYLLQTVFKAMKSPA